MLSWKNGLNIQTTKSAAWNEKQREEAFFLSLLVSCWSQTVVVNLEDFFSLPAQNYISISSTFASILRALWKKFGCLATQNVLCCKSNYTPQNFRKGRKRPPAKMVSILYKTKSKDEKAGANTTKKLVHQDVRPNAFDQAFYKRFEMVQFSNGSLEPKSTSGLDQHECFVRKCFVLKLVWCTMTAKICLRLVIDILKLNFSRLTERYLDSYHSTELVQTVSRCRVSQTDSSNGDLTRFVNPTITTVRMTRFKSKINILAKWLTNTWIAYRATPLIKARSRMRLQGSKEDCDDKSSRKTEEKIVECCFRVWFGARHVLIIKEYWNQ